MRDGKGFALRTARACGGLVLFAFGVYLTIQAGIGLAPWDVFSMGLSMHLPVTFGTAAVAVSLLIVLIDLLLRERIGLGTLLDAVVVGQSVDLFTHLELVPEQSGLPAGAAVMLAGMFIMSFAQYLYMGARLCCGPRDTLMVGIGKRLKRLPIGLVNLLIQVAVLAVGWLLGGPVGIGTLLSALGIGVTIEIVFRLLRFEPRTLVHQGLSFGAGRQANAEG